MKLACMFLRVVYKLANEPNLHARTKNTNTSIAARIAVDDYDDAIAPDLSVN